MYRKGKKTTAISESVALGIKEAFQAFERSGFVANVGDRMESFEPTLIAACKVGDERLVDYLLSLQKDRWTRNLHWAVTAAVKAGHEAIFHRLLAAGIVPNHDTLLAAVKKNQLSMAELLMDIVRLEQKDFYEETAGKDILSEAVLSKSKAMIRMLIHAGIPLNNVTVSDSYFVLPLGSWDGPWIATPLSTAIIEGNQEAIQILLSSSAQVNVHSPPTCEDWWRYKKMTALAASVAKRDFSLVHTLLERGADPFDNTAIYIATVLNEENLVKKLLCAFLGRYGTTNGFGAAALSWATDYTIEQMVRLLVPSTDANCLVDIEVYNVLIDCQGQQMSALGVAI
jgi:hypothetical protein